jgi:uncharacterized cupin superfamily protein
MAILVVQPNVWRDSMSRDIVVATAGTAELNPSPIKPSWVLSGTPDARNRVLAKSQDRTSYVMVWECTPGQFNWHYAQDETVTLLEGEVFITDEGGAHERRLGPGDMAFFPAGSKAVWRVTKPVRKVAVLREALPRPVALGLLIWRKLARMAGLPILIPILETALDLVVDTGAIA